MSTYKALALDIDGTLLNRKKEVTDEVLEKIHILQQRGIPVMIASGRPEQGIRHVAKAIDMDIYGGYVLSFNGGKITDFKTGEVVYNTTIPLELHEEIIESAHEISNATILTYQDTEILVEDPENEYAMLESKIVKMPLTHVANLSGRVDFPVNKFLVTGDPDVLKKEVVRLADKFAGRLGVFQSEPFFIEIVPLGIDKARSLDWLLHKLGIKQEELVACGDGGNDVTMIEYAGIGVAMENACEEVKRVANDVTASCDTHGVARVIEKYF